MFKNYLLLSLKVLKRKPFYTFISLFGISFTLLILMLLTSMATAAIGEVPPQTARDRMVVLPVLQRLRMEPDTVRRVDSIRMDDGSLRYDTVEVVELDQTSNSNGPMSYAFFQNHLLNLEQAEKAAAVDNTNYVEGYLEGQKFTFNSSYVSGQYFDIFDHTFLAGGPLLPADEAAANKVTVITDKAARAYFGEDGPEVIGREMRLGQETFTVRGVIARPLNDSPFYMGDVYFPATTLDPRQLAPENLSGGFMTAFLTATPADREALKAEIKALEEGFPMPPDSYYTHIELYPATILEAYAMAILLEEDSKKAIRLVYLPIVILLLLFVALPLLNLINLNVGRVHERQSEIGVRKAFGARGSDILYQFIFENLVLTLIGGLIGLALAVLLINYINGNDLLGIVRLTYAPRVIVYFLFVIIGFGLLSGWLPAYRMSRVNVADSLR